MADTEELWLSDDLSYTNGRRRIRKTKAFQCRGHGKCRMTFSRSEHLIRHIRKHTGEKPYTCIISSCTRKFTRFDNMMQHAQIHGKPKKNRRILSTKSKKQEPHRRRHRSISCSSYSCEMSSDGEADDMPCLPRSLTQPYGLMKSGMILPQLASYLVDHPDAPPESYLDAIDLEIPRQSMVRQLSMQDLCHPLDRLAVMDVHTSSVLCSDEEIDSPVEETDETMVQITQDEFEAIQGFGRFRLGYIYKY
ncbi:uncharacterized protein BYT42DRAFT_567904 [Radiomyces spectabilis]|uniref:uncharacterized protein n=1 Tax=Radiomyces spectabilis TaxID=64574 RepID=UPI00221F42E2|nr:uncharacterized protein BYT42DRAFT_567904 [Radiomyces spectabilis]KAI8379194.1 hypothetical protein BYT42DRAFT_567904 [Radiomyces spectabilis]